MSSTEIQEDFVPDEDRTGPSTSAAAARNVAKTNTGSSGTAISGHVEIQSLELEQSPAAAAPSPSKGLASRAWAWLTGAKSEEEAAEEYTRALTDTQDDFADLEAVGFLRAGLRDKKGRPVVMIIAKHFQAKVADRQRVYRYIVRKLDSIADSTYSVVWVHTTASYWENCPSISWLLATYETLPAKYRSNLSRVYVLHSDLSMWAAMMVLGPWLSAGFWSKVEWLLRVEFLWDHVVQDEAAALPEFVVEHDAMLEEHPLLDYGVAHMRESWMPVGPTTIMPQHSMADESEDVHVQQPQAYAPRLMP